MNTRDETRTRIALACWGILSPLRLPIPPPGRCSRTQDSPCVIAAARGKTTQGASQGALGHNPPVLRTRPCATVRDARCRRSPRSLSISVAMRRAAMSVVEIIPRGCPGAGLRILHVRHRVRTGRCVGQKPCTALTHRGGDRGVRRIGARQIHVWCGLLADHRVGFIAAAAESGRARTSSCIRFRTCSWSERNLARWSGVMNVAYSFCSSLCISRRWR